MLKPVLSLISVCTLSSCCVFGFTQDSYEEWDNPAFSANEVWHIRTSCQAEIKKKELEKKQEFLNTVKQSCSENQPFADVQFVRRGGQPFPDDRQEAMRQRMAASLCGDLRQTGKISEEKMQIYCAKCDSSYPRSDLEACYRAGGLQLVKKTGLACKPMSFF